MTMGSGYQAVIDGGRFEVDVQLVAVKFYMRIEMFELRPALEIVEFEVPGVETTWKVPLLGSS